MYACQAGIGPIGGVGKDAGAFFQAGETDCGASCPVRSGVLRRTIGRCMIDLTRRGTGPYVARTWRTSSSDSGSMYDSHVQLRTDNPVTGQHREQHSREFVGRRGEREVNST